MSQVECMVLGLLNQGYRYGHELDKVIEERNMRIWSKLTRASMYQALVRIKKKGWVETGTEKEGKLPEKTIYTLTDAGKEALRNMVFDGLASSELMEFQISIFISFLYILPLQQVIEQLEKRKKARIKLLEDIPSISKEDEKFFGKKANIKLIKSYYKLEIEWLESLISELKENNIPIKS